MVEDEEDNFNFQASWNMVKRLADAISHPALAVAELIKNAYDADASEVLINMKEAMDSNPDKCKMVISDNGHGMTLNDIKSKWSNIGVSANKSEPFSKKGRFFSLEQILVNLSITGRKEITANIANPTQIKRQSTRVKQKMTKIGKKASPIF